MNSKKTFAYTMNGTVVWLSDEVFNIPVLNDLYRVHLIENIADVKLQECYNYSVKIYYKFLQSELVYTPLAGDPEDEILLNHEKIKNYVKLKDYINYSYSLAIPNVFVEESDQKDLLARCLVDYNNMSLEEISKHEEFLSLILKNKKEELKNRYTSFVHKLKSCKTLNEVKEVGYSIVFEGINVV